MMADLKTRVRFYVHGEVVPDEKLALQLPYAAPLKAAGSLEAQVCATGSARAQYKYFSLRL